VVLSKSFSDVRASFRPGISILLKKKGYAPEEKTAFWEVIKRYALLDGQRTA
jgi:hypothetical protein